MTCNGRTHVWLIAPDHPKKFMMMSLASFFRGSPPSSDYCVVLLIIAYRHIIRYNVTHQVESGVSFLYTYRLLFVSFHNIDLLYLYGFCPKIIQLCLFLLGRILLCFVYFCHQLTIVLTCYPLLL